jgi:uncharacterized membrane protein
MTTGRKPLWDVSEKQARLALFTLISVSTLFFSYLAYLKYACFSWETSDTALFSFAFNQALKGKFFFLYVLHGSLLGNHPNLILPLWFPVFWLAPVTYSLLLFQSLAISLAAWPIYLLARDQIHNRLTALIASAGFLLFPPIVGQHVQQIHDDQFGLALLLFALYYFERGHFRRFLTFLALCLLAKETLALTTAFFGLYALRRRRSWKWVVSPVVLSVAYMVIALGFLMPRWGVEVNRLYARASYFSAYGHSPLEVLQFITTHPLHVIRTMCGIDQIGYLWRLLQPLVLVLPFRNCAWILAVPALGVNFLSSNHLLRDVTWHYSLIPGGILFASFVLSVPRWSKTLEAMYGARDYSRPLCVAALLLSLANCGLWFSPTQYQRRAAHNALRKAIQLVPPDASVLCSEDLLAHFSRHPGLNSVFQLHYYGGDINQVFDYDYVVIDGTAARGSTAGNAEAMLADLLSKHPSYRSVFSRDGVAVFERTGIPAHTLTW